MTVKQLIEILLTAPPESEAKVFDPETGKQESVTGITCSLSGPTKIHSDDIT